MRTRWFPWPAAVAVVAARVPCPSRLRDDFRQCPVQGLHVVALVVSVSDDSPIGGILRPSEAAVVVVVVIVVAANRRITRLGNV